MDNTASLVFQSEKGTAVTTSLLVAEKFGKRHADVLRAIDELLSKLPENECKRNFALNGEKEIPQPNGGYRKERIFVMTRDGFTLLVMGFTGSEAMKFKIEFIQAFNNMESLLKSDDFILAKAMNIMQHRIESLQESTKLQAKALAAAAPKVDYFDTVLQAENTHTITTIAKELGMSGKALNKELKARGIAYHQDGHWVLYAKYQGLGYTKTRTHKSEVIENRVAVIRTHISTVWTEKGREFLHKVFKPVEATICQ